MSIQRYCEDLKDYENIVFQKYTKGEWVKYEDVKRLLDRLTTSNNNKHPMRDYAKNLLTSIK